jgi:hypothetical protein
VGTQALTPPQPIAVPPYVPPKRPKIKPLFLVSLRKEIPVPELDEKDIEEIERLAKRLLDLCARAKGKVDRATARRLNGPLSPESQAQVEAQVRKYLKRQAMKR